MYMSSGYQEVYAAENKIYEDVQKNGNKNNKKKITSRIIPRVDGVKLATVPSTEVSARDIKPRSRVGCSVPEGLTRIRGKWS